MRERGGTREEEEEEEEGGRRRRGSSPSPASPSGPAQQLQQLEIEDEDEVAGRDNFEDNPRGGGGVEGESIPAARTFRLSFPFVRCSTSAARPRGGSFFFSVAWGLLMLSSLCLGLSHVLPIFRPFSTPGAEGEPYRYALSWMSLLSVWSLCFLIVTIMVWYLIRGRPEVPAYI